MIIKAESYENICKIEKITRVLINGFVLLVISIYCSKEVTSEILTTYFFYTILSVASTLGIEGIIKREYSRNNEYFKKIFITKIIFSLVFFLVIRTLITINEININIDLLIIPIILQSSEIYEWKKIANHEFKFVAIYRIKADILSLLTKVISLFIGSVEVFIISYIIEWLIIAYANFNTNNDIKLKEYITTPFIDKEIIWYILSILLIIGFNKLDQYIAIQKFGKEFYSQYAIALQLIQVPILILNNIYLKKYNLILAHKKNSHNFIKKYRKYSFKIIKLALILLIFMQISTVLIEEIYRNKYLEIGYVVKILSFNIISYGIAALHQPYWINIRNSNLIFYITSVNILLFLSVMILINENINIITYSIIVAFLIFIGNTITPLIFKEGRKMMFIMITGVKS